MKGIVFNLFEDAIIDEHGDEAWEAILDAAGADGVYTALGNYPDAEMLALVGAACEVLGAPADRVLRGFGRVALPALAARYPEFLAAHASARGFLLTLDHTVHREVVKLYPDARPPRFTFEEVDDRTLIMRYASERRLCSLAEGMIDGAAAHFGETVTLEHVECMHDGAERCTLVATFA